jgi:DsbC/DsbD-like thiol-disulfide interchange protein
VLAATVFLAGNVAAGEAVSPWAVEGAAKVRLVAAEPAQDGLRAGLEIRLEPGWKTYWINPGPTGLPPKLDFSGSENLASAEPLWPAPIRFADGDADSVGYSGAVIVPLRIAPKDTGKPVLIKAVLNYGICEKICIPGRADLALVLDPATKPDAMAAIEVKGFEKRVPARTRLGGDGALAITALARTEKGLGVSVRFPEGAAVTDLFASSPDAPLGVPEKTAPGSYRIGLKPDVKNLDLVAVADGTAIRVPVTLDDKVSKP